MLVGTAPYLLRFMAFTFEGGDKSGVSLPSISVILALSLVLRGLTNPRHSGKANAKVRTRRSFDIDQGKPRGHIRPAISCQFEHVDPDHVNGLKLGRTYVFRSQDAPGTGVLPTQWVYRAASRQIHLVWPLMLPLRIGQ